MLCSSLLMSSCDTYTGSGAYAGSSIGSILGSAIGGLSGGPRGSDIGTIVGMAGGAMVGAAIGSQADKAQADREAAYQRDRIERSRSNYPSASRHHSRSERSSSDKSDDIYDYSAPVTDNSDILIPIMEETIVSMISRVRIIPVIIVLSSQLLLCHLQQLKNSVSDYLIALAWRL